MTLFETSIPGCYEVQFIARMDDRGFLVKTAAASVFRQHGLETDFVETFYSCSREGVLRGMHLQLPPADHAKLVYCVTGSVMDIALDLRRDSPEFGKYSVVELSSEKYNGVYIPRGVAHGFYVRDAPAIMCYHTTCEYVPACDGGVAWNSFGAEWPTGEPHISHRDSELPGFTEFESPFQMPLRALSDVI